MRTALHSKPQRSRGTLMNLSDKQHAQLNLWFVNAVPYQEIRKNVTDQFHLECKSLTPVHRYWKKEGAAVMKWQNFIRHGITPAGWELTRLIAVKRLEDLTLSWEQRKAIIRFLETGRFSKPDSAESAAENSPASQTAAAANPLDDEATIADIRLLLLGPPPPEKCTVPSTPQNATTAEINTPSPDGRGQG